MKRSTFIKNTGLVAGGMLLNKASLFGQTIAAAKVRVGVIGCGDRGQGLIHVLNEMPDILQISAVCDVLDFRIQQTKAICKDRNLKIYKEYKQLIDDKAIDAVIIAVPLYLHFVISSDALKADKHVYVEKTMTYDIPQAQALVKLVQTYPKRTFQVGHQYRYTPLYFKVKDMIAKGYLGKVTQIDARWDRNWDWRRPLPPGISDREINWRMYREYSGGLVAELLSHQIDFINWAFNTHPDEFYATGGIDNYKDGRETFDNVQVMLRYGKEGMIGNFGATCSNAREGYIFKIKGTKGSVELLTNEGIFYPEAANKKNLETVDGVTGATKIEWNKDGGIPISKEAYKDGSWYALNDFYKSIQDRSVPFSNVTTGATTAVCVHLANQSAYNQTITHWKPDYNF